MYYINLNTIETHLLSKSINKVYGNRNKYKENGRKVIYRNMNKQCMELVKNTGAQLEYLIE